MRDEETFDSESVASVLHGHPQGSAGESSIVSSSRKTISALSPEVRSFQQPFLYGMLFKRTNNSVITCVVISF